MVIQNAGSKPTAWFCIPILPLTSSGFGGRLFNLPEPGFFILKMEIIIVLFQGVVGMSKWLHSCKESEKCGIKSRYSIKVHFNYMTAFPSHILNLDK